MEALYSERAAQTSKHILKDIQDMVHPNAAALLRWDEEARQFLHERIAVPKGRRDRMTVVSPGPVSLNGRMLNAENTPQPAAEGLFYEF